MAQEALSIGAILRLIAPPVPIKTLIYNHLYGYLVLAQVLLNEYYRSVVW